MRFSRILLALVAIFFSANSFSVTSYYGSTSGNSSYKGCRSITGTLDSINSCWDSYLISYSRQTLSNSSVSGMSCSIRQGTTEYLCTYYVQSYDVDSGNISTNYQFFAYYNSSSCTDGVSADLTSCGEDVPGANCTAGDKLVKSIPIQSSGVYSTVTYGGCEYVSDSDHTPTLGGNCYLKDDGSSWCNIYLEATGNAADSSGNYSDISGSGSGDAADTIKDNYDDRTDTESTVSTDPVTTSDGNSTTVSQDTIQTQTTGQGSTVTNTSDTSTITNSAGVTQTTATNTSSTTNTDGSSGTSTTSNTTTTTGKTTVIVVSGSTVTKSSTDGSSTNSSTSTNCTTSAAGGTNCTTTSTGVKSGGSSGGSGNGTSCDGEDSCESGILDALTGGDAPKTIEPSEFDMGTGNNEVEALKSEYQELRRTQSEQLKGLFNFNFSTSGSIPADFNIDFHGVSKTVTFSSVDTFFNLLSPIVLLIAAIVALIILLRSDSRD